MDMFTDNKKARKFILFLVLLIVFNFIYPNIKFAAELRGGDQIPNISSSLTTSNEESEGGFFDISTNFTKLLFLAERSIYKLLNDIFCDNENKFVYKERLDSLDVVARLSPESIISGKFILFDANIFKEIDGTKDYYDDGGGERTKIEEGKDKLRKKIAGWYYNLRNFVIVGLLSVLVYVAIRMVISTISQDKAKYKTMFKDWLVALCLLILMHYIMISIFKVTDLIIDSMGTSNTTSTMARKFDSKDRNYYRSK